MTAAPKGTSGFYVVGGTMRHDAPSYVERTADKELLSALLRNEFCHVLTARQMGKSSLMLRTAAGLRNSGVRAAVLDLTAIGQNLAAEQWYGGLALQIGERVGLEQELLDFWRSQTLLGPMQRWVSAIRRVVLPRERGQLVIFVDEIDAVRSLSFSTDEFFAGIRECYNLRNEDSSIQRLTFCLLGVASPSDLIRDTRTTPFNVGKRIELSDFAETEALTLANGLGRETEQNRAILKRVLFWTNGHPYLTQRICQAAAEDEMCQSDRDVDQAVQRLFFSKRAREYDDNLIFVRERLLRSGPDLTALLNQYARVLRGKTVADDDSNPLVEVLLLSGITRTESGALRVRNRIYRQVFDKAWISSNLPDAEVRRQREAFKRGVWRTAGVSMIILGIIAALALIAMWERKGAVEQAAANRRLLYLAQMKLAHQEYENANIARVEELVDATRPEPGEEDLRGFEWFLFSKWAHSELFRLSEPNRIADLRFSAGNAIALAEASHVMFQTNREYLIKSYDRSVGKEISSFAVPAGKNFDIAVFSPDLKSVATDSPDYSVVLWDAHSGAKLRSFRGHSKAIKAIVFSRSGQYLASSSIDGAYKVWDIGTGAEKLTANAAGDIPSLALSPDGSRLAVTTELRSVKVLNVDTGKTLRTFTTEQDQPGLIFFSPDGRNLIAASLSGLLRAWDVQTGQRLPFSSRHSNEVVSFAYSPDGSTLATGSVDRIIKLWDAATGQELRAIRGHGGWVTAVHWSPDGKYLMTGDSEGMVKIWEAFPNELPLSPGESITSFRATGFSLANELLALGTTRRSRVKIWNLSTGRELADLGEYGKRLQSAAFSKDSKLAAVGLGNMIMIYETDTGKLISTLIGHDSVVYSLDFSPDGKTIVSGDANGGLKLWDVSTGIQLAALESGNNYYRVVFSPDGKTLASADQDGSIRLWDAASLAIVKTLVGHTSNTKIITFSPDGRLLATAADDNTVRLWNVASGTELKRLVQSDAIQRFAFSPDGKRLVTGSLDGSIRLWDVSSKQEIVTLRSQGSEVTSVTFSANGGSLAVSGKDGSIKVWQAE